MFVKKDYMISEYLVKQRQYETFLRTVVSINKYLIVLILSLFWLSLIVIILFFSFVWRAILWYLVPQNFFITQIFARGGLDGLSFRQAGAGAWCQFKLTGAWRCHLVGWSCFLLFDLFVVFGNLSVNLLYDRLGNLVYLLLHLRFQRRGIFIHLILLIEHAPGTELLRYLRLCHIFCMDLFMPVLLDMFARLSFSYFFWCLFRLISVLLFNDLLILGEICNTCHMSFCGRRLSWQLGLSDAIQYLIVFKLVWSHYDQMLTIFTIFAILVSLSF